MQIARVEVENMPNLQIRDLPVEIYNALKTDASIEQRSLTQQAIVALREAQQQRRSNHRSATVTALRASQRRFDFGDESPEDLIARDRQR